MRRGWLWGTLGVAALVLAGCSGGDDNQAANNNGGGTTVPAGVATSVTNLPGTTAALPSSSVAPSSIKPASSTTSVRPSSSTATSTSRPSSSTTSSTTTPAKASCGQIAGGGPGGDVASDITATGVPCSDATGLVAAVKAGHNFVSGPRTFTMNGYSCTVVTDNTGLPVGHYSCHNGSKTVTWDKT